MRIYGRICLFASPRKQKNIIESARPAQRIDHFLSIPEADTGNMLFAYIGFIIG